jgi:hypothetical protein
VTSSPNRLLVALAVAVSTAACLPQGAPPAGRQIVADRSASLGAMVPPNGDGISRVLFMRPNATDSAGADLYVIAVDGSGELSPERLLVSDIAADDDLGCTWKVAPCGFDARGRIAVYRNGPPPQPGTFVGVTLVDPVTGDVTETSPFPGYTLSSPSGQRSFVMDPYVMGAPPPSAGTLTEADGRTARVQLGTSSYGGPEYYGFTGEDFYYIDPNADLIDLPPSDVPRQVAAGVAQVNVWMTPDGPLMLLSGPTADPTVEQLSLRDPVTGALTVLPFTGPGYPSWSSDFRYLLYTHGSFDPSTMIAQDTYALFDRTSGATLPLDLPAGGYVQPQWRPGRDQIWIGTAYDAASPAVAILTPGAPTITVTGPRFQAFSDSGTYWFSTTDSPNVANPALDVGVADDPTGPRYPYNPPGTWVDSQWELPDGRLLESTYVKDIQRADAIVVDPRTGDSRLLAERGRIAALGQTRFMGMYHFEGGRGDLTFVELDTGRSTVLAPEFTITAFAEPQGADLLAPGARVVYQFQARTSSPYDGLWLVNSP